MNSNNANYTSENGVLFNKDKTTIVCCPAGKLDTTYTIPYSVTSIDNYAFYGCSGLIEVTIPNSVTSIGDWAFYGCSGLSSITIPNSVTIIGNDAFSHCSSLQYNEYDSAYYFGNDENPYLCLIKAKSTDITSCEINNNCKTIYYDAFDGCRGLTSITIPNSITSIGDNAFYVCKKLTSVTIPNSVTSIGNNAFFGCSGLTSITIGNSVTSIEDNTFGNCNSLTSVTIPNSVTSISESAFQGCSGLTSITIPNSVTSIGNRAFSDCGSLQYKEYDNAYYLGNSENPYLCLIKAKSSDITSCEINNNCKIIYYGAFSGCYSLKSVIISNSVESIGSYAFNDCIDLISVIIPNSVERIASYAFDECIDLVSVTIPNSVKSIGGYAFNECFDLTITCEAESQPSGWDKDWNYHNRPVVWGYTPTPITVKAVSTINIYTHGNTITVENATAEIIVYDAMGRLVARRDAARHASTAEIRINTAGIYIVKVGNVAHRVMVN